jgi:hypothetical protein
MLTRHKPMARGKAPQRPGRPDRSDEFASYRAPAPVAVMATAASFAARVDKPAAAPAKLPRAARTDQAIRDSANGEECHVRLTDICNGRTDTTVWSHWPGLDADRGMGMKAIELCGAYSCAACHDAIDGRAPLPEGTTRTDAVLGWMFGHLRSLVALARKGLV